MPVPALVVSPVPRITVTVASFTAPSGGSSEAYFLTTTEESLYTDLNELILDT